ncbi:MAG: tetratricopeptide repeat protein, partial [Dysgonamonadaceae bacterium]|nr:tetratricopeptide repeat protein [Dysgonamonadaceae bacterium]
MRNFFTTFCLSLFSIFLFAQNTIPVRELEVEIQDSIPVQMEESRDSLKLIDDYLKIAQYRRALELLNRINLTDSFVLLEKKVVIYEATQKYSLALACYESLIQLDPTSDYYRIQKANALYICEKIKPALALYEELCDSCDNVYLLKRIAMCYEKLNDERRARYHYARALDQDTTDAYATASLAKLLIKAGQYGLAKFVSDRYIAFDSTYNTINSLNAYAYYNLEMYGEAAQRFEKCLQRGDSSLFVTRGLGTTYFFMENDSLANPMLELAYKADTTNSQVLYALAQTFFNLDKYPEAIKYYEILLEKDIPSDY